MAVGARLLAASRRKQKTNDGSTPMTLSDSFLSNAGWLFFAAWSAMVVAVGIAAFGSDLLPWSTHLDPAHKSQPANTVHPTQSSAR